MNFDDFAAAHGMKVRSLLGKKKDTLCLVETEFGEQRVLRRYPGPAAPCQLLLGEEPIPQLAQVYACYDWDGDVVSEEEYLEGICLSEILHNRLLTAAQTSAVVVELCLALERLHGLGLVHRDMKPENVMLTREGRVVLMDLDAVSQLDGTPETNTTLLGTVGYAAPEQFGFSRCDVRVDIFALGVMMNVMLTGEHPSVRMAKGRLGRMIQRCIQTNADRRYPNVAALCRKLPKAASLHPCPLCGAVSPGSCLWCGGPATAVQKGRTAVVLSAAALAVSAAALVTVVYESAAHNQTAAHDSVAQPELHLDWSAVEIQKQVPVEIAGSWPADKEIPYRVPFLYDLDGDGTKEQFFFALAEFYSSSVQIDIVQHGTWGMTDGQQMKRFFMPVICRMPEDGVYVPVPELAELLTAPELQVYSMGETPEKPVSAELLPEMEYNLWQVGLALTCSAENTGNWVVVCRADLAGAQAEAAMVVTIEKIVSD